MKQKVSDGRELPTRDHDDGEGRQREEKGRKTRRAKGQRRCRERERERYNEIAKAALNSFLSLWMDAAWRVPLETI